MLKEKIKNIFNDNKRYYTLGISNTSGVLEYHLLKILFKDNELKIEDRHISQKIDDEFKEHLNKNYPVILNIEGDGIINKRVENKSGYRKNLIFKSDLDDFYFYEYRQDKDVFISVARKELIDTYLNELRALDVFVIHVSYGPFVMGALLPLIKGDSIISSNTYSVEIRGSRIFSFEKKLNPDNQYTINGDIFKAYEVPLIATFFSYKFPKESIEFDTSFLDDNASEFKYKKWFKIAFISVLFFFLITLVSSHLLHDSYMGSLLEKESRYALALQTSREITQLDEEKALKEKILLTTNMSNKSFVSKYVVDIGNSTLPEITLKTIHVIPMQKKIEEAKKIDLDFNHIIVLGKVSNDLVFNRWIKKIEKFKWVKKMDIIDYTQENKIWNEFFLKIEI